MIRQHSETQRELPEAIQQTEMPGRALPEAIPPEQLAATKFRNDSEARGNPEAYDKAVHPKTRYHQTFCNSGTHCNSGTGSNPSTGAEQ